MAVKHKKISRIRTGGQTGVDRAAMDFAREYGIPLCGWCPKNGWAEDVPGILAWLDSLPDGIELCIGGPRESECITAYDTGKEILSAVFNHIKG